MARYGQYNSETQTILAVVEDMTAPDEINITSVDIPSGRQIGKFNIEVGISGLGEDTFVNPSNFLLSGANDAYIDEVESIDDTNSSFRLSIISNSVEVRNLNIYLKKNSFYRRGNPVRLPVGFEIGNDEFNIHRFYVDTDSVLVRNIMPPPGSGLTTPQVVSLSEENDRFILYSTGTGIKIGDTTNITILSRDIGPKDPIEFESDYLEFQADAPSNAEPTNIDNYYIYTISATVKNDSVTSDAIMKGLPLTFRFSINDGVTTHLYEIGGFHTKNPISLLEDVAPKAGSGLNILNRHIGYSDDRPNVIYYAGTGINVGDMVQIVVYNSASDFEDAETITFADTEYMTFTDPKSGMPTSITVDGQKFNYFVVEGTVAKVPKQTGKI